MQNNNPLTEAAAIVLAGLLVIGGALLTYAGKIDFTQATFMYTLAAGIYGGNLALKAPSPAQQQNMQQIISDLTSVIPVIFQHTHPAPSAPPSVAAPAPQAQQPVPPMPVQQQPFPNVTNPNVTGTVVQNTGRFPAPNVPAQQ